MIRVKICGLTNAADAGVAVAAGADYLGFIFYPPSPRAVDQASFLSLRQALGEHPLAGRLMDSPQRPLLVGVFVNSSPPEIAEILDSCGLDLAQLSGDEPPEAVVDPASPIFGRAYKALRPGTYPEGLAALERYRPDRSAGGQPAVPQILVDTPHGTLYGGTGQTGDWALSAALAGRMPGLMLAGGLNPANVAEAVRRVKPFAVDVAGGVEASPGRKDPDKVRLFIDNARNA
ncbi:MAG: phosphoribosylanthranilate isomerase [Chloroflexota bacterium]|jgi:phosphoribosylanthranilate isomerase